MHIPLVPPYADWHTGMSVIVMGSLAFFTVLNLVGGYDYGSTEDFKNAHYCAIATGMIFVFGVWAVAITFLFFFIKSILIAWKVKLPNFRGNSNSSSDSQSRSKY